MIKRDNWTEYTKEEIAEWNTRELMTYFDTIRAYMTNAERMVEYREQELFESRSTLKLYRDYYENLKDILSTREHIPNKQEAKVIRQQKAKDKKNR